MLDLKPRLLWSHFEALSRIPRCSGNEKEAAEYILQVAKRIGLQAETDEYGNVVIIKPGKGCRDEAPEVILQAHIDMVCEKNKDSTHDFEKDAIVPKVKDGWVQATATSLGADNAIGLAAGLAIFEDNTLQHPPLALLVTVEEEIGLKGAAAIEPGFVKGRILINLDAEDERAILIGCAGGLEIEGTRMMPCVPHVMVDGQGYRILVEGLSGGHSGIDICKGRGNAIKVLAHSLIDLRTNYPELLVAFLAGGSKSNAIPRSAEAVIMLGGESSHQSMEDWARNQTTRWRGSFGDRDPGVVVKADPTHIDSLVVSSESSQRMLHFLSAVADGVSAIDAEVGGMTETSSNLAIVETAGGKFKTLVSFRSSRASDLDLVASEGESLMKLMGMNTSRENSYPAWERELDSSLLTIAKAAYKDTYEVDADVSTIHAGLECGILAQRLPGLTAISIGPNIMNPHSPDEKVEIVSVDRFWKFLGAVLEKLAIHAE